MRLNTRVALCLFAGAAAVDALASPQNEPSATTTLADGTTATVPATPASNTAEANKQLAQLAEYAQQAANATLEEKSSKAKRGSCTLQNVQVRREWSTLSKTERKAYTDAVLCLQSKQSKTPPALIPGAKSRFDDWVGTHINQTLTIHYTGTFLAWHRYFTWHYEQALRNECGYTGTQPYWDWAKTAKSGLENSAMLDGSDYSMSGNGAFIPNQGDVVLGGNGLPEILIPAGTGGGCVTSGPFKNMKVNLGPVALGLPGNLTEANGSGLGYNPRCLKRDLTDYVNRKFADATAIVNNILKPKDVYDFQMTMQGYPGSGNIGVHGGGHYSMGGDPGRDLFVSPGDPLFYLHHANIDRTWWIWQLLDLNKRTGAEGISGTGTFLNSPSSPNTTLDTIIDLGYAAGPPLPMRDLMSSLSGPFCYIYL